MLLDLTHRRAGHRALSAGQASREGMSIYVSVVVPTYKRTQLLEKCLRALVRQDFPPHAYEIIIVDDAGWDETRCVVEQFSCWAQSKSLAEIRYTRPAGSHGPAAARNAG